MGTPRRNRQGSHAVDQNIRAVSRWESDALHERSRAERLSDWITLAAAKGSVVVGHLVWFTFWILANGGWIPGVTPFDPFPYALLTTVVSLEAIFLSLFVLASQNRLSLQTDKRDHLDLQIDLLAEREMTAVLSLLHDIARHLEVKTSVSPEQLNDLGTRTDIYKIVGKLDRVAQAATNDKANGKGAALKKER